MSKRMAIFTVSIGHGHHQVSKALLEEWEGRGFEGEIIDIFSKTETTKMANVMKKAYLYSIYRAPKLWDWTYRLTNVKGAATLATPLLQRWSMELLHYCNEGQFDYIVATHPLATQIGRMIKRRRDNRCKLFAVLTDFSTHSLSIAKDIDGIFVAEGREQRHLQQKQSACSFYSFGIPLTKNWDDLKPKAFYRKKLAIPLQDKIIVIAGGGEGIFREEQIMEMLGKEVSSFTVFWFLGKGQQKKQSRTLSNGTVIQYLPFSKDYPAYVKGADLFLSKPGGVSMAESLRWQIPTGILPPLPGQEKINQQILKDYPHAKVLDPTSSLVEVMEELTPQVRTASKLGEGPCAREQIIDCILRHKGKVREEQLGEGASLLSKLLRKPSFTSSTRNP